MTSPNDEVNGQDSKPDSPPAEEDVLQGGEEAGSGSIIGEKKADESWKERARKEKDKLASTLDEESQRPPFPPAGLLALVEELFLRALLALGQIPHPATGEVHYDPEAARYTIDLLGVLEEKTRGKLPESDVKEMVDELILATNAAEATGGGPLWAVDGIACVAHGRSRADEIAKAIGQAKLAVEQDLVGSMKAALAEARGKLELPAAQK